MARKLVTLFTVLMVLAPAAGAVSDVSYRLVYDLAEPDHVSVRLELKELALPRTLVIPRAIPMGYGEQHYDRFVSGVRGFSTEGLPITPRREEGPRWRFEAAGDVTNLGAIAYRVGLKAMERNILSAADASKVRKGYLGLLGYSVFGYVEGLESQRIELEIRAPEGWPAFTTLAPSLSEASVLQAEAADFYALADSQVLMGPKLQRSRAGESPPLYIAAYAEVPFDHEKAGALGRQALDALAEYFGSVPFDHYTMVIEVLEPVSADHEYGFSMEHLDSATFFLGADRTIDGETTERELGRHLYNYAHHIAHSWIPKRCAGKGYFPFSWELAPVLESIWFSEGFGQYAAAAALAESMPDRPDYLERLVDFRFRRSLEESPAFIRRTSTVELSRVASTRYSEDFRTGKAVFSRGGMMAAEMDVRIREKSRGRKSLKEALRFLVDRCATDRKPLDLTELPKILKRGSGVGVRDVFDRWIGSQPPLD